MDSSEGAAKRVPKPQNLKSIIPGGSHMHLLAIPRPAQILARPAVSGGAFLSPLGLLRPPPLKYRAYGGLVAGVRCKEVEHGWKRNR
jgi:hypothetical protein